MNDIERLREAVDKARAEFDDAAQALADSEGLASGFDRIPMRLRWIAAHDARAKAVRELEAACAVREAA